MLGEVAAEAISVAMLALVLGFAVIRPRGWGEAVAAVPAAILVIAVGAVSPHRARVEAQRLGPVIGFLAAVLMLAQLCADEGLFRAGGDWMARALPAGGRPGCSAGVFMVASVTTAVLSLDATVVLLTPVVFATAARARRPRQAARLRHRPPGELRLAAAAGLQPDQPAGVRGQRAVLPRFAGLMAVPWLAAIAVEYVVFRRFFRTDLDGRRAAATRAAGPAGLPVFTLVVLAATLAGFAVTSLAGVNPAWAALRRRAGARGPGAGPAADHPAAWLAGRRRRCSAVRAGARHRGRGRDRQRARRRR